MSRKDKSSSWSRPRKSATISKRPDQAASSASWPNGVRRSPLAPLWPCGQAPCRIARPSPLARRCKRSRLLPDRVSSAAGENASRQRATPYARRLAQIGGIDLAQLSGTGPRGRIQARDVQARLAEQMALPTADPVTPAPEPEMPAPHKDLRAFIAARVSRSNAEIPHFYVTADAEFDAVSHLRHELNADPRAPRKLSVTALGRDRGWRERSPQRHKPTQSGVPVAPFVCTRSQSASPSTRKSACWRPSCQLRAMCMAFAAAMDAAVEARAQRAPLLCRWRRRSNRDIECGDVRQCGR